MARLEVVQSRVMSAPPISPSAPTSRASTFHESPQPPTTGSSDVVELRPVAREAEQGKLDDTEKAAVRLLSRRTMSTIEIKDALDRSREHTARLMKSLFERGLVRRDDSKKPFVYELTEEGWRYIE